MSDAQTATPTKPKISLMETVIQGRIEEVQLFQGVTYTRLVTPAPDAYSRPQFVAIRSKRRFGAREEEVTVKCKLGGYTRKAYEAKDKETGELLKVTPVEMTLDLIE